MITIKVKYMKQDHPCKWERLDFITEFCGIGNNDYNKTNWASFIDENYEEVIEHSRREDKMTHSERCEFLYKQYQEPKASDIRSMSMGDIIQINNNVYYCNNVGFELIHVYEPSNKEAQ